MKTTLPDRKINPAKRGDLFVLPTHSSATYVHGPTVSSVSYQLASVTSVTRAGVIKGYCTVGDAYDQRSTPAESRLIRAETIDKAAAVTAYIARGDSVGRAFGTLEEAKAFLKPFMKIVVDGLVHN